MTLNITTGAIIGAVLILIALLGAGIFIGKYIYEVDDHGERIAVLEKKIKDCEEENDDKTAAIEKARTSVYEAKDAFIASIGKQLTPIDSNDVNSIITKVLTQFPETGSVQIGLASDPPMNLKDS